MSKGKAKPQVTKNETTMDPAAMARINETQDTVKNWAMPIISGEKSMTAGINPFQAAAGQMLTGQLSQPARYGGGNSAAGTPAFGSAPLVSGAGSAPVFGQLPKFDQLTVGVGPTIAAPAQVGAASMDVGKFLNPYMKDVVDSSLADFDVGADRSRNSMNMRQAASGAFGGGRHGVASGVFEGEAARGRGSLAGGLRSQAYGQAAQMADAEAGRAQQAAMANAQMQQQAAMAQAQLDAGRIGQQDQFNQLRAMQDFGLQRDATMATPGLNLQRDQFGLQRDLGMGGLDLDRARFDQGAGQQNFLNTLGVGELYRGIENEQRREPLIGLDYLLKAGAMTPVPQTSTSTTTGGPSQGKGGLLGGLGSLAGGLGKMGLKFAAAPATGGASYLI